MRLSLTTTSKLVFALALSGLLLSGCASMMQGANANNLTIECRIDDAIAAYRKMEDEGGTMNMKIVANNLPGVLLEAGRQKDAIAEIQRLARKLAPAGDFQKTEMSLGVEMDKTVIAIRDTREHYYGFQFCRGYPMRAE